MASDAPVALSTAAGLESQKLSPRRREGPKVPARAKVAHAVLAGHDCLEGVGAEWRRRGIAPYLAMFAGQDGG